jgi:tRNA threonylcarbamoyl adenosine modification protein (Sua5/YciO/YrdC/YwlC family)
MLLKIHGENPSERKIAQVVDCLVQDGVIIYPSDTIYALGCSMYSNKALERVCKIRNIKPKNASFSVICEDISQASKLTRPISNAHFKLIKRLTPGPYTFILPASQGLPKLFQNKKKTIGVRIQQTQTVAAIIERLGHPLVSASLKNDDDITPYYTDPSIIYDDFQKQVDLVIDGGFGGNSASTVLDLTKDEPQVIRKGLGVIDF